MAQKDLAFPFDWNEENNVENDTLSFLQPAVDLERISRDRHVGSVLYKFSGFEVIFCETCGFIHVANPPSQNKLTEYYKVNFYTQERKKNYFTEQLNSLNWWQEIFRERLSKLEAALGRKGKLLDVGCGPGYFLNFARENGWHVEGLEPSTDAVTFAINELKLSVFPVSFENYLNKKLEEKFDVVYSHGVIEHVLNPIDFINKSKRLLTKNGLIFSSVANDFNIFQYAIMKQNPDKKPWWIVPPEHLNYFTANSLKRLFKNCGLSVKSFQSSFPMDLFPLMGMDYTLTPEIGKKCQEYRENFEFSLLNSNLGFLKSQLYENFASIGLGRQIDIIGRIND